MRWRLPVRTATVLAIVLVAATLPLIGCISVGKTDATPTGTVEPSPTTGVTPTATVEPSPTVESRARSGEPEPLPGSSPYLLFNQRWLEGMSSDAVDLDDVDAVFWQVFSGLSDEVTVYPSENYYYFILNADGKQMWGNIRLSTKTRDDGVLSFAYFEFREFPNTAGEGPNARQVV